ALCNYYQLPAGAAKGAAFDFDLSEFCIRYSMDAYQTSSSLKFLEKEGYIMTTESFYRPTKVHVLINPKDLYKFQVEHPEYDAFIKLLLRSYEGILNSYAVVRENDLARRSSLPEADVTKALQKLSKMNIISYVPQSSKPQIIFTEEVLHPSNVRISKETHHKLKELSIQRMEWVIHYATSTHKCRSEMLLSYFGEEEPVRCGICDVCIERNKLELSDLEFENIAAQLKDKLLKTPMQLTDLVHSVQQSREDKTLKTVQWLIDNGKMQYDDENKLVWRK
ncbi:MAG TPA: RecQ family zinc-binding domain-containing protein, partial [Bacteroidia bacterium]|nr:RecQ family zinc-binding domain-containing protein [Bacteroidia bacterium]